MYMYIYLSLYMYIYIYIYMYMYISAVALQAVRRSGAFGILAAYCGFLFQR